MRRDHFLERELDPELPQGSARHNRSPLPHTWNAVDGMDGNGSYLRTTGVYTRTFTKPQQPLAGGRTYVEVLAALRWRLRSRSTVRWQPPMRAASPSSAPM